MYDSCMLWELSVSADEQHASHVMNASWLESCSWPAGAHDFRSVLGHQGLHVHG